MKHSSVNPEQLRHPFRRRQHEQHASEGDNMRRLSGQKQHDQHRYHRCSTPVSSSQARAAAILTSSSCCSRSSDSIRDGLGVHHLGRRRRRRPNGEHGEQEHLSSKSFHSGNNNSSSSSSRSNSRRRQGAGLATAAASVVLFASSTAAASAATATAATVIAPASAEFVPSRMVGRQVPLRHEHRREATSSTAFVSSAAAGIEPVRRWAAAGYRRLARATHQTSPAEATTLTTTTAFLGGGLRGGSGDGNTALAAVATPSGRSGRSRGSGVRMMVGAAAGFSGEFTPPDESWKSRKEQPVAGSLASQQQPSDAKGQAEQPATTNGDGEEEEVYSWPPRQNGQGSWDGRKGALRGAAAAAAQAGQERTPVWRVDLKRGVYTGDVKIKQPLGLDLTECNGGVCISKVLKGCSADRQGVRVGDRVVATSATLGDGLWEKNTVDGVLSAVGTRLVFSDTVTLRVERALDAQQLAAARFRESVTQTYEVTLERPPGLILEQAWDSSGQAESVVVKGILPDSPAEASGAVECGDKVVAVSSSLGNIMWPYRQLEGALSAIERHIGNTINIRFQRTVEMGAWTDPSSTETNRTIDSTLEVFRNSDVVAATSAGAGPFAAAAAAAKNAGFDVDGGRWRQANGMGTAIPGPGTAGGAAVGGQDDEARTIVLERCGALMRSYGAKKQAIAVENLLGSMVKAGVQMNARFLNNALMAFLSCGAPEKAVDTFHAVTGIVWPQSAPWPDSVSGKARGSKRDRQQQLKKPAAGTADDDADSADQFPEEFQRLQAGPSAADAMVLEAASWEGTGGQRFLQMRAVAEQVAEQMSNRVGGGGGAGGSKTVGGAAGSAGEKEAVAAAVTAAGGPLKLPALGEYVGGCRPNGRLVATVVKAHGRCRRLDEACRVVLTMADWGLKPDVAVFNSLAAAAVWNGRVDLALQVVLGGVMQTWGINPNQLSFNTIMDAYAREGNVNNVVKIYNYMQGEGIPPDAVATTILVKAQVGSGDVDAGARTLIRMMKSSELSDQLDAFPFNTIIQGFMKTLQWHKAMDLFRGMRYHGVKPDLLTFNSLIAGLNKARVPAVAVDLYKEMLTTEGMFPDVYTYSSLISAYAKLGNVEEAVKILSDMARSGVKPNRFTLSSVMQACIRGGQPKTALEVYDQLTTKGGVRADKVIYTLVVQARAMMGEFDEAFQVITAMGKSGDDNKVSFNHLIKECVLAGEWDKASEAITRMVHHGKGGKGVRFDHNTFNAVSEVPRGYDGTEAASWPRLKFLMKTKEMVLQRKWEYSSTLYLAILYECMGRQDYAMAHMVVEERKAGLVFVHPADRQEVEEVEGKIDFKMTLRPPETVWIS